MVKDGYLSPREKAKLLLIGQLSAIWGTALVGKDAIVANDTAKNAILNNLILYLGIQASAGAGLELGMMFTGDWERAIKGGYMAIGGSGGLLGKVGADLIMTKPEKGKLPILGIGVNAGLGGGAEGHSRFGIGKGKRCEEGVIKCFNLNK